MTLIDEISSEVTSVGVGDTSHDDLLQKPWKYWPPFMGHIPEVQRFLAGKKLISWWVPLIVLDALFRGYAQIFLCNSSLAGFAICVAVFFPNYNYGLFALMAGFVGVVVSLIVGQKREEVSNGLAGLNPVLLGCVVTCVMEPSLDNYDYRLIVGLVVGAVIVVYITLALDTILRSSRIPLPYLSLPFNIMAILLISWLNAIPTDPKALLPVLPQKVQPLDSASLFRGSLLSAGQVFGSNDLVLSSIIFGAIFIFSPLLGAHCYLGAVVGTLSGYHFRMGTNQDDIENIVYQGVYGYNGLLTAGAIGGLFFFPSVHSTILALVGAAAATVIQEKLTPIFFFLNLPILTMPFNITTMILLSIHARGLRRVSEHELSFAELHIRQQMLAQKRKKPTINAVRQDSDEMYENPASVSVESDHPTYMPNVGWNLKGADDNLTYAPAVYGNDGHLSRWNKSSGYSNTSYVPDRRFNSQLNGRNQSSHYNNRPYVAG